MKNRFLPWINLMGKFSIYALVIALITFNALLASSSRAQGVVSVKEARISLRFVEKPLNEAFQIIENNTEYTFVYKQKDLDPAMKVTIDVEDETIETMLIGIARQANVSFRQVNDRISVKARDDQKQNDEIEVIIEDETISGTVYDENGEGLPGATVVEKGTNNGTITDVEGKFTMSTSDDAILLVSFVGYKPQEVKIAGRSTLLISMEPDMESLDEVVVIGYGSVKKSDLTGSVVSVKADDLVAQPSLDAAQSLQGRAAGLQVQATNGEPGSEYSIRIRGGTSINASSDPLIVVDGFVGAVMPSVEDIASVEILKDASATAIYGSRGANGVILITTKEGKTGDAKISFSTYYSSLNEINRIDVLKGADFIDYINDARPGTYDASSISTETDWQDLIFRDGSIQNYQLSISGGNNNMKYYLSGVYFDQVGIMKASNYDRMSLTANFDFKVSEKLKISLNSFNRRINKEGVLTQEPTATTNSGVISSAQRFEPVVGIYDANGNYTLSQVGIVQFDNPVAILNERTNETKGDYTQNNLALKYNIMNGLTLNSSFGLSITNNRIGSYGSSNINEGAGIGGNASMSTSKISNFLTESFLSYDKQLQDNHTINLVAGYSFQDIENESLVGSGSGFITDAFIYWNLGGGSIYQPASSGLIKSQIASFYGRANYKLMDRYLLTLTGRYDGASSFSKNNKWAFFPSGALAWEVTNESFMSDFTQVSQLKLRASHGLTGSQAISPYQSLARYRENLFLIKGQIQNSVVPAELANNDLTWETTAQTDLGIDLGLFDDRITITADWYNMVTSDLLFDVPLPNFTGFSSQLQNIGKVQNRGYEIGLATRNDIGEVFWRSTLNVSHNENKVLHLPGGESIEYAVSPIGGATVGGTHILEEGRPVGSFYGYVYEGVYQEGDEFLAGGGFEQEAGGEKFKDLNDDQTLDGEDREIIGNPHPDFIWGWQNEFVWKGVDISFFFQSSVGNDVLNFNRLILDRLAGDANATTDALKRWSPSNTNTDVPKANAARGYRTSTRWIEDGSYLRLKNIVLGYTLPDNMLAKVGIEKLRLYVSGQNLLTFTDYKGVDPEVNYRYDNKSVGVDFGSYPNSKSVTVGLNMEF